ncbi:MAG: response regulator [Gammaproteobacteria bacterium]|nr:response regulator [Gammaproteobacteria bacterium]
MNLAIIDRQSVQERSPPFGGTLFDSLKYSRLSRRMLLFTVLCGSLFILLATAGQLYSSYRNKLNSINSALQTINEVHVPGIANSIYFLDIERARIQMKGALNLAGIVYLDISERRNAQRESIIIRIGNPDVERKIVHTYPLEYRFPSGETESVGILKVIASLDGVLDQLWWDGLKLLLISTVLIGLVSATIFLIVQLTLTRHLVTLAQFANQLNLDDLSQTLRMDLDSKRSADPDELDQLVTAIVQMRDRIRADYLERTASQAEYRQILETVTDGFLILDNSLQVIEANKTAARMIGLTSNGPHRFNTDHSSPPIQPEQMQALFKQISNKSDTLFETQFLRGDGNQMNIEISSSYTHHRGGRYFCFLRDITERRRTENALRRSQKMDALGQLTGGIAHDFNNILGIILGYAGLLEQGLKADPKAYKQAQAISRSARRGADLTRQLLNFSSSQVTSTTVIDCNQIIGEMDSLITRSITPKIRVVYDSTAPLWLCRANRGDFEDALLNLIINARDAMPDGGCLTLKTKNMSFDSAYCIQNPGMVPGDYVMLEVTDDGKGIPYELQEQIFEPFFTTKPRGKGTGLGLAMVFGFIKRSGGHLKVSSEPEKGSSFQIYLPRTEEQASTLEPNTAEDSILETGRATLLVVDDEVDILELAQSSLSNAGYQVLTAEDGHRALQLLEKEPDIKLLISDIVMPGGINGYELAIQATALRPDLRILFTSGFTDELGSEKSHSRGEHNLLSKPYQLSELIERVQSILN